MARVFLYEDTGGALYLHREGDPDVLSGIELAVPYGAEFQHDAASLAGGAQPGDNNQRIPFDSLERESDRPTMRAVAVWEDGKVRILHTPGRDARTYLNTSDRNSTPIQPGYQK